MKYSKLSQVERLIRKVVEDPFGWLSGDDLDPYKLAKVLFQTFLEPAGGDQRPPNRYYIYISANRLEKLGPARADVEQQVADYVRLLAERIGIQLSHDSTIRILASPNINHDKLQVEAAYDEENEAEQTAILSRENTDSTLEAIRAVDAFLILQGRRHLELTLPMTRIGRRIDNDFVIDVPTVSRQHAQIRWRNGHFVLFDVSGKDNTTVNGQVIKEHILVPGDVVGLNDVVMVYGEGRQAFSDDELNDDDDMESTQLRPLL